MQLTEKESNILERLDELFYSGQISNDAVVSIMKQCEKQLQLKRVSEYARTKNISTQGARKFRAPINICGYAMIIDND